MPALPIPEPAVEAAQHQEDVMPKGVRSEPCPDCGTTGIRCKKTCPTRGKKAAPVAEVKPKKRRTPLRDQVRAVEAKRRAKPKLVEAEPETQSELDIVRAELEAMSVEAVIKQRDEALELARACDQDLRRRRELIDAALNELPDPDDVKEREAA